MDLPTYTNIWRIEKRLYKLYDFRLPMPLPVGQIAVFLAIAVPYVLLLSLLGLPFSHTLLWLYVLPPGVLAWLTTRPVLEGKRLPELVISQVRYLLEPRTWCRMAPLAEKDEITITGRVWRRAEPAAVAGTAVALAARRRPAGPATPLAITSGTTAAGSRGRRPGRKQRVPSRPSAAPRAALPAPAAQQPEVTLPLARRRPAREGLARQEAARQEAARQELDRRAGGQPGSRQVPSRLARLAAGRPAGAQPPARQPSARPMPAAGITARLSPRPGTAIDPAPARPAPGEPVTGQPVTGQVIPSQPAPIRPAAYPAPGQPGSQQVTPGQPAPGQSVSGRPGEQPAEAAEASIVPASTPAGTASADQASATAAQAAMPVHGDAADPAQAGTVAAGIATGTAPAAPAGIAPAGIAPAGTAPDDTAAPGAAEAEPPPPDTPPAETPPADGPPPRPARPVVTVTGDTTSERPLRVVERALRSQPGQRHDGWRERVVVVPGGHRPGKPDQMQRDRARARLAVRGSRRIVVLGCTRGAGQTVTALLVGDTLARLRGEPVAVLDLNPGRGSLTERASAIPGLLSGPPPGSGRTAEGQPGSHSDAPQQGVTYPIAGLEVIDGSTMSTEQDAGRLIDLVAGRYPLTFADPAASCVPRALAAADLLLIVAPASAEAVTALGMTFEWLEAHGHGALAETAITVLNGVSAASRSHVEHAAAVAAGRCRAVVSIPWDGRLSKLSQPRDPRPAGSGSAGPAQDSPAPAGSQTAAPRDTADSGAADRAVAEPGTAGPDTAGPDAAGHDAADPDEAFSSPAPAHAPRSTPPAPPAFLAAPSGQPGTAALSPALTHAYTALAGVLITGLADPDSMRSARA